MDVTAYYLFGSILALVGGATLINQGKRAWEKHYDIQHALRNAAGTLRNASRHFVRTAHRLNHHNRNVIDKRTFQKARINIEFVSDVLKTSCAMIGSAKITYAAHRLLLNMRNINIDIDAIVEILPKENALYLSPHDIAEASDETAKKLQYIDYLFEECLSISYIFNVVASKLESAATKTQPFKDLLSAMLLGETSFVANTNSNFEVGSYIVNTNILIKTLTEFMNEPGDTDDLVALIDRVPQIYGPGSKQKIR